MKQHWQETAIEKLVSFCEPNENVRALVLFGSCSAPTQFDHWSDIDLLLVVKGPALSDFFPTIEWLKNFGTVYTYDQSSDEYINVTRVCFEDLRRVDLVIATEESYAELENWTRNPFYFGLKVLFSRSIDVDKLVTYPDQEPPFAPAADARFRRVVREFRFKSMLAVYKVVRNDLLIAVHLALDLMRDCSLLGMMLRDRTEGTNIHKEGGIGNQYVERLQITQQPFTPLGILETIVESNLMFEKLASEWSEEYQENLQPLLTWIARAREEIFV